MADEEQEVGAPEQAEPSTAYTAADDGPGLNDEGDATPGAVQQDASAYYGEQEDRPASGAEYDMDQGQREEYGDMGTPGSGGQGSDLREYMQGGRAGGSGGRGDGGDSDDEDLPIMPTRLETLSANSRSSGSRGGSRPVSGLVNLRGSRPNSAAVAAEIEGFEDDFMEPVDEEGEEGESEHMTEDEEDLGPTVEELIVRAQQEQHRLMDSNEQMQRRVRLALDFRNKGRPQVNRDMSRLDGVATRYRSALKSWIDILEERDRVESHYQTTIFDMKSTLEERIKRADDISKAYKHFRVEVAKSAEHTKTGRPISEKLLGHLEAEDQDKEEEVQRVRLKNIHLTNQLRRIEHTLRQKEELAEGLHLIDFEQLKIENQSLNEKIEERNEELLKLKKKTTTTVQILTHVREKLQFIEKENASLTDQLQALDVELAEKRDRLGHAKANRDSLRLKGRKIKENSVFITNMTLLDDIDMQKQKKEDLAAEIDNLRHAYAVLAENVARTNDRIATAAEDMGIAATLTDMMHNTAPSAARASMVAK